MIPTRSLVPGCGPLAASLLLLFFTDLCHTISLRLCDSYDLSCRLMLTGVTLSVSSCAHVASYQELLCTQAPAAVFAEVSVHACRSVYVCVYVARDQELLCGGHVCGSR